LLHPVTGLYVPEDLAVPASAQVVKLMKRIRIEPRQGWQQKIEDQGFVYYKDYYNESAAYAFHAGQIDALEEATEEIFRMCSEVVKHVIDNKLWAACHIPEAYAEMITASWQSHAPSLYGRMDLAYNGKDIKLLEFNAGYAYFPVGSQCDPMVLAARITIQDTTSSTPFMRNCWTACNTSSRSYFPADCFSAVCTKAMKII
jgi:phage pi2 protein 07